MSQVHGGHIRLVGISVAVPGEVEYNESLGEIFGQVAIQDIVRNTGIESRPVSRNQSVSQLGIIAARRLLQQLDWSNQTVDMVIVVTQTPDYPLPATACLIQHALGLNTNVLAFDIGLGCSGYVYGLSVINGLMAAGAGRRAILICGDITSRMIEQSDRSLRPLFGDAVSATAIDWHEDASIIFDLGSDGGGAPFLISKTGGLLNPGLPRLFMDGVQVMAFALRQVGPSIERVFLQSKTSIADIDLLVFHQANAMMIKLLAKKIGAAESQVVLALKHYGNTSSASIPLTLCDRLNSRPTIEKDLNLLLCGFGVGWSWASAVWKTNLPKVMEVLRCP